MKKTIGIFGYTILKRTRSNQRPFNPIVHIAVERWSQPKDGGIVLSAQLMTEGEIDHFIQAAKKDLASVGAKARAALKKAKTEKY